MADRTDKATQANEEEARNLSENEMAPDRRAEWSGAIARRASHNYAAGFIARGEPYAASMTMETLWFGIPKQPNTPI